MKFFPITRQRLNALLTSFLCISFLLFFSACTNSNHPPSDTGSVSFSVEWRGAPIIKDTSSFAITKALDCVALGVSTVEAQVYDETNWYLAGGGPWNCSAHAGTIENVPAGSNRKAVILGKDSSGDVLYSGEVTGIAVIAGQTTNTGTIVAQLFNPTLLAPEDGLTVTNGAFSFEWSSLAGASQYQIQVSTDNSFETTAIDTTTSSTNYTPSEVFYGATYYWRVKAKDSYGNASGWSEVWSFTVSTEPGIAPSVPTNVNAAAGDGLVSISWDSVSGATSYNIYLATWSGALCQAR